MTAAERPRQNVLATAEGLEITVDEVTRAAAGKLVRLERQRHELISQATRVELRGRLLEREAEERGVTLEELLEIEVDAKVGEISQEEIEAFYGERQGPLAAAKQQTVEQIRGRLAQKRRQKAYDDLIARLESRYQVEYFLGPYRVDVAARGPSRGPLDAPVTLVEFSDFECPHGQQANPVIRKVREVYGEQVQIVFRQFPRPIHDNARKAGEASLCAHEQGKFWEMHDALFAAQDNLGVEGLRMIAAGVPGLDPTAFNTCLDSGKYAAAIEEDLAAGVRAGVSRTPAFFVNGRFLNGAQPFKKLAEIIDDELTRLAG